MVRARGAHWSAHHWASRFVRDSSPSEPLRKTISGTDAVIGAVPPGWGPRNGRGLKDCCRRRGARPRATAGAVLRGAVRRGEVCRGAVLRGAVLRGAVLRGAMGRGTLCRGAVLCGAVLRGAAGRPRTGRCPRSGRVRAVRRGDVAGGGGRGSA
ncbi:pentapeptide repeat-containing protein [Streptomyces uncialis]|uniref:pentapeptide repeat-containing protein n=1 Tax=Streptomyces uncialis TaxID=1048205 RepID=UPI00338D843B